MKRIIVFLAFVFLLSFIVSSINAAEPQKLIYDIDVGGEGGINVKIYTPYQAYPNDAMTIRVIVRAKENLTDVTISLKIYGSMNEGYAEWPRELDALKNRDMDSGAVVDQYFNVSTARADPGLLHGYIYCSWKVWRNSSWQEQSIASFDAHQVTYLKNKLYEDLQVAYSQLLANHSSLLSEYNQLLSDYNDLEKSYSDLQANYGALLGDYNNLQINYDSLNSTYYSLLSDYSSLQASFNELKSKYEFGGETTSTLNLMYVFIETTVIFIATTIYFAHARMYSATRKSKQQT